MTRKWIEILDVHDELRFVTGKHRFRSTHGDAKADDITKRIDESDDGNAGQQKSECKAKAKRVIGRAHHHQYQCNAEGEAM
ncbi:MAG: hypothetical protein EXR39_04425 [Betaproteobacteria bacterium]|nr:hypothetical protein [Betaproteobacteria bacterium]